METLLNVRVWRKSDRVIVYEENALFDLIDGGFKQNSDALPYLRSVLSDCFDVEVSNTLSPLITFRVVDNLDSTTVYEGAFFSTTPMTEGDIIDYAFNEFIQNTDFECSASSLGN